MPSITRFIRLPSICPICQLYHTNPLAICKACHQSLQPLGPACQRCAFPLPDDAFPLCGHCIQNPPHFDKIIAAYRYEEPLRTLLHEFKYREGLYLTGLLVDFMIKNLPEEDLDGACLIPVPIHPKRLRKRGFNQAAELARGLSKKLQVPYERRASQKIRDTLPQAALNAKERKKNLRNAFQITLKQSYPHVILIDDLVTTGSTVNELAKALKDKGIARVDVWSCARAI